jgi:hypothetical protein
MRLRVLAAGVGAVAAMVWTGPAGASPLCAGEHDIFALCVDPTGSSRTVCIYAGPPPCRPVTVPIPTAWCEGALLNC